MRKEIKRVNKKYEKKNDLENKRDGRNQSRIEGGRSD
jgi:hypothetical protein